MNEAWAHVALFPHTHPHAPFSTVQDVVLTLLFLGALLVTGRMLVAFTRKLITKFTRS